jgi:CRISPR-associated exonuclease Cas4
MEEVLTGETASGLNALVKRAGDLLEQLALPAVSTRARPLAAELGATILRTFALPDIAKVRHGLLPELTVYGTFSDAETTSLTGRADAVFVEADEPRIVFDWKSDVDPSSADIELHAAQLRIYMRATNVSRGALVYMSTSKVHWLED